MPFSVGGYFDKIACFCFNLQVLQPHERVDMPVTFYVDPAMLDDREARDVTDITLSYTMYPADAARGDAAAAAADGDDQARGGAGRPRPDDRTVEGPDDGRPQEPRLPHPAAEHLAVHRRGRRHRHAGRRGALVPRPAGPGSR